jgi:hypothetical protein
MDPTLTPEFPVFDPVVAVGRDGLGLAADVEGVRDALPNPDGSLPALLMPLTLPGPAGTPDVALLPAPAAPAAGTRAAPLAAPPPALWAKAEADIIAPTTTSVSDSDRVMSELRARDNTINQPVAPASVPMEPIRPQ